MGRDYSMKKNIKNIPSVFPKEFPREDILRAIDTIEIMQNKLKNYKENKRKQ